MFYAWGEREWVSAGILPSLSEKFRRTVRLWTHERDLRDVEQEEPDVVIVEMTERLLSDVPPTLMRRKDR